MYVVLIDNARSGGDGFRVDSLFRESVVQLGQGQALSCKVSDCF